MKICSRCKQEKQLADFYKAKRGKCGRQADCKTCHNEYYNNKKDVYIQRSLEKSQTQRQELKNYVNKVKENPCMDCGNQYHPCQMDFDHISNKIRAVADMVRRAVSLETLKAEIDKCELVCSNCHRLRTHNRLNNVPKA